MNENIQVIVLVNGGTIISRIDQVMSELGEPDCKLTKPRLAEGMLPWMGHLTDQTDDIMISSDKILTMVDPKQSLLDAYLTAIK